MAFAGTWRAVVNVGMQGGGSNISIDTLFIASEPFVGGSFKMEREDAIAFPAGEGLCSAAVRSTLLLTVQTITEGEMVCSVSDLGCSVISATCPISCGAPGQLPNVSFTLGDNVLIASGFSVEERFARIADGTLMLQGPHRHVLDPWERHLTQQSGLADPGRGPHQFSAAIHLAKGHGALIDSILHRINNETSEGEVKNLNSKLLTVMSLISELERFVASEFLNTEDVEALHASRHTWRDLPTLARWSAAYGPVVNDVSRAAVRPDGKPPGQSYTAAGGINVQVVNCCADNSNAGLAPTLEKWGCADNVYVDGCPLYT